MTSAAPCVPLATLENLAPFGNLTPEALRELSCSVIARQLRPGTRLFQQGDQDDWTFFLLEGDIELESESGGSYTVSGGDPAAAAPLAPRQPREATARARTDARVLRVSTALLEVLGSGSSNYAVEEVDDHLVENQLLFQVFEDYANNRLEIPTLPDVAMRIRTATQDPDASVASLAKMAGEDPSVAARLIRVANSPAFRGQSKIANCRDAIARLGLNTTQQLVTALALKQLFCSKLPEFQARMHDTWLHSARVGALSSVVARLVPHLDIETALLAGLIHDVGVIAVLARAETYPELATNPAALDAAIRALRDQVGAMILRSWDFPEELVTVAVEAEDWYRDPGDRVDYCDVVLVAEILSFMSTPEFSCYPRLFSLPAFNKVAAGNITAEGIVAMIEEAEVDIRELMDAIAG